MKEDFHKDSLLRGIIGAIDGTHILIKAPKVFNYAIDAYCNYKIDIVTSERGEE